MKKITALTLCIYLLIGIIEINSQETTRRITFPPMTSDMFPMIGKGVIEYNFPSENIHYFSYEYEYFDDDYFDDEYIEYDDPVELVEDMISLVKDAYFKGLYHYIDEAYNKGAYYRSSLGGVTTVTVSEDSILLIPFDENMKNMLLNATELNLLDISAWNMIFLGFFSWHFHAIDLENSLIILFVRYV